MKRYLATIPLGLLDEIVGAWRNVLDAYGGQQYSISETEVSMFLDLESLIDDQKMKVPKFPTISLSYFGTGFEIFADYLYSIKG